MPFFYVNPPPNPPPFTPFFRCISIPSDAIPDRLYQILCFWKETMETNLVGKTFVVTGATSGIGLATAETLVRSGADVIGVGRSLERCQDSEWWLRSIRPDGEVDYITADLSLQREVHQLADQVRSRLVMQGKTSLDGLINNAATFSYWFTLTADGVELQWAVNHLAPFLLTNEMLPALQQAPSARVVTVSSASHYGARLNWEDLQQRRHYNGLKVYGTTKLANILFTLELNRRLKADTNVRAFAADPGLVKTNIGFKGTPAIAGWVWKWRRSGGIDPLEAANGIAFLVTEPSIHDADDLYWKHGQPKRASRRALDANVACRLWEVSAQMCGLVVMEVEDAAV
jgi:NAD(P)-dependent dehydrogenase (short-subunit alcohol dehydrogenase family)